ncbi:hypothetical protein ACFWMR_26440 [Amycolatopsis thailandensis]|uniref:hypothetical protein n=1 Tax=Amycolatopsis thailandensis TaxID=589330 RepID=UPI00366576D7
MGARIARKTDRPMWIWAGCALTSVLLLFGVVTGVISSTPTFPIAATRPSSWPDSVSV